MTSTPETSIVSNTGEHKALAESLPADLLFTTANNLFVQLSAVSNQARDAFLVQDVSPIDFKAIEQQRDQLGRKFRLLYVAYERILFITMPTARHELLHTELCVSIDDAVRDMGLRRELAHNAATKYNASTAAPALAGSSGEGDSALRPRSVRPSEDDWPSVIIESGYSQTLSSLRAKAAFWFAASDHAVKIILLAKAYPDSTTRRILLEHWQERLRYPSRQGATETRASEAAGGLVPHCVQTINICLADGMGDTPTIRRDPNSYSVVRGPLQLDFTKVFLRAPAGPHESNLVVSDNELKELAALVRQDEEV